MYKCFHSQNVQMFKHKILQMFPLSKCSNVSIHKMYKCFYLQNVQMFLSTKCSNVSIHKMYKCLNIKYCKCLNIKYCKCLNIKYCKCFLSQNVFFLHNFGLRAGSVHTCSKRMVGYRAEQVPRKKANWILISTQTK